MNSSTPGLPACHYLPEHTQTHAHWVSDAIQPSHLLLSPSPPTFNLSQHQGLFQLVSSSHQVVKVLELQFQHQSFQWISLPPLLWLVPPLVVANINNIYIYNMHTIYIYVHNICVCVYIYIYVMYIFLVAQMVKNLPAMYETQVWSLGWEDPLEKEMVLHSSILA